jgi:hypothetical protein
MVTYLRVETGVVLATVLWGGDGGCGNVPAESPATSHQTAVGPSCDCPLHMDCDVDGVGCVPPRLGQRPGDACGPSGEGAIPFGECDVNRGLRCVPPRPGQLDAPATCQCAEGQSFSPEQRSCAGARLGESEGDRCGPDRPSCSAQRGLVCRNGECSCEHGAWCADTERCIGER